MYEQTALRKIERPQQGVHFVLEGLRSGEQNAAVLKRCISG